MDAVKIFHGNPKDVEKEMNAFFESEEDAKIKDIKLRAIWNSNSGTEIVIFVLYEIPDEDF